MKTKLFLLFIVALQSFATIKAAVITVDNNVVLSGKPAQYDDIQTAINDAFSGDTILVVGSPVEYANITITKKLTLIGPGFNLVSKQSAQMAGISIVKLGNNSSNSIIDGFGISSLQFENTNPVQNFVFRNNSMGAVSISSNISNVLIYKNLFSKMAISSATNVVISNNIMYGNSSNPTYWGIFSSSSSNLITVKNNLFLGTSGFQGQNNNGSVVVYSNNIFYESAITGANLSTFNNNLTFNCPLNNHTIPYGSNVGSGNKINQDPLFLNVTGAFSWTNNYTLHSTSPCKNAGTDGTDIGPTGGSYPFVKMYPLTSMPAMPYIKQMMINGPSSVKPGNSVINVTVKASKQD